MFHKDSVKKTIRNFRAVSKFPFDLFICLILFIFTHQLTKYQFIEKKWCDVRLNESPVDPHSTHFINFTTSNTSTRETKVIYLQGVLYCTTQLSFKSYPNLTRLGERFSLLYEWECIYRRNTKMDNLSFRMLWLFLASGDESLVGCKYENIGACLSLVLW